VGTEKRGLVLDLAKFEQTNAPLAPMHHRKTIAQSTERRVNTVRGAMGSQVRVAVANSTVECIRDVSHIVSFVSLTECGKCRLRVQIGSLLALYFIPSRAGNWSDSNSECILAETSYVAKRYIDVTMMGSNTFTQRTASLAPERHPTMR
jgi:hypothetical protein